MHSSYRRLAQANLFFCLPFEVPIPREVQDQADMSSLHPLVYCFGLADKSWLTLALYRMRVVPEE